MDLLAGNLHCPECVDGPGPETCVLPTRRWGVQGGKVRTRMARSVVCRALGGGGMGGRAKGYLLDLKAKAKSYS